MTQRTAAPPAAPAAPGQADTFQRTVAADGTFNTVLLHDERHWFKDAYHFLLVAPWSHFLAIVASGYLVANVLFALLFLAGGDCIANARPGSFADAFFFSVQTMATIGYGAMAPATTYAHILVSIEALLGLLGVAMATGLMFARFSRPTARVLFSNVALINRRNGKPHLSFRVANMRGNQIVEATMRLTALMFDTTAEGERMRRFHDLALVRSQNPIFAMTWTVMHVIDEKSPLHGMTLEEMRDRRVEVLAILVGIDGTFLQTIHARRSYTPDEIILDARFVDVIKELPDGKRGVELKVMHDWLPEQR